MALQFEEAGFGIICLTPENLNAPWVLFEAGALSKSLDGSRVCPYLFGFEPTELTGPLVQFQAVQADRADTMRLLGAMNRALGEGRLADVTLEKVFEKWWPDLDAALSRVPSSPGTGEKTKLPPPALTRRPESVSGSESVVLERLVRDLLSHSPSTPREDAARADRREYVFIVHGHAHGRMEEVARFIEKMGANAIILHEQPSRSQTVIEKLETYSDVGFAVVIMTGDDVGSVATSASDELRLRARQNVILELGYFLGKLGRTRVCVLYEGEVEIPSDYAGVLYIPLDPSGSWRLTLARELRVAGIKVDLNQAF